MHHKQAFKVKKQAFKRIPASYMLFGILPLSACGGDDIGTPDTNGTNFINLLGNRSDYSIDATGSGYTISTHGQALSNHAGGTISFSDGGMYLLRDTGAIIANGISHLENYSSYNELLKTNVTWLHTGATWGDTQKTGVFEIPETLLQYPSLGDTAVVTAYINIAEITGIGGWDPHWDPSWDANNDNLIDVDESALPSYLQGLDLNEYWGNYIVNYWEPEWKQTLFEKIDYVMAQNFDGVMFDVTTAWSAKLDSNPNALNDMATLMADVTNYIHTNYGNTALSTFNIGPNVLREHPELAKVIDAAYFQNSYFQWTGDGEISDYYDPDVVDLIQEIFEAEGKVLYVMDHVNDPTTDNYLTYLINSLETDTVPMIGSHLFENFTNYPIYRITAETSEHVTGWEHSDIFYSDASDVVFSGNGGNDIFAFSSNSENNIILDFDSAKDQIVFFDTTYAILAPSEVTKVQGTDGTLELICSNGASVMLENFDFNQPLDLYSGVIA